MLTNLWDTCLQFQYKNGTLLVDGKIYVYFAGRTELATTYADIEGSAVNPNPIIIDNHGQANCFVDDAFDYTIIVKDAYGNEQFSRTIHPAGGEGGAAAVTTIVSDDDSIAINASTVGTVTTWNLQVRDPVTKSYVDTTVDDAKIELEQEFAEAISDEENAREAADNNLQAAIDDISAELRNALDEKKDKQLAVHYAGNNKRTITDLRQDENGKITFVTFSDIDFPEEVPNIEITSDTLDISSTVDPDTNTKSFTIDVRQDNMQRFIGYYGRSRYEDRTVKSGYYLPVNTWDNYEYDGDFITNDWQAEGNPWFYVKDGLYLVHAIVKYSMNATSDSHEYMRVYTGYHNGLEAGTKYMDWSMESQLEDNTIEVNFIRHCSVANNTHMIEIAPEFLLGVDYAQIQEIQIVKLDAIAGGSTYTAGDAVSITNNTISVKYGNGLEVDTNNKLQVKLGKGLKFDTEAGIEGEISIDDIGQEVIEEVQELSSELDKKITTTFNYAQIKNMSDFAPYGVSGTTRLVGQLFSVPIASEIRKDDTLICVRALQNYNGNISFGIFEFDFEGNEGSGSTTWLADTGVVSVQAGENAFPIRHIVATSAIREKIKMEPGKLYYATILIAGDAPASGLYLASDEPYEANYNATPKYTMVASNMDPYVDWSNGSQRNTWFQGYNEFHDVPRLFMMIRNGEAAPVPIVDPFMNFEEWTLQHQYRLRDLFSLSFNVEQQPVLFQKIRPAQDCTVTEIGWVDYHLGATYDYDGTYYSDIPLILDANYNPIRTFADATETFSGKVDGEHYGHQFILSTPIALTADTNYFVPCNMKISGVDEWIITYSQPEGTSKDLILFDAKWNVASWAGNHAEYLSSQPGTCCRIFTDGGNSFTF